jgi:hypothetical protein
MRRRTIASLPESSLFICIFAVAAGLCVGGLVQAHGATNGEVTLSPQNVAFPPPEYATLPLWDHMAEWPLDTTINYYNHVRGRDAYELLAAIYGGRPSDYWAPAIWEFNGDTWTSRPPTPGEWIAYPHSYGTPGDDATDHLYLTGHSIINLTAGEYQLGQGVIELGEYNFTNGTAITRNSVTINGAGMNKTLLNGAYARDSLYALSNNVTVEIRDLSINSSVGSLASAGFTLSNVKVDIPLMAYTDSHFSTFGYKHGAISVYIDNSYASDLTIGDMTIENCIFINDSVGIWITALDYGSHLSRNLTIAGNTSVTGGGGILVAAAYWDGTDGYTNKIITNNRISLRQSYLDEEVGWHEGIWCDSTGSALIANNEIKFEDNALYVWGIEIGTYFPAIDVVVKNNRIYHTFSGDVGEAGGFGITIGGYWGNYTASHDNIFVGNNLSQLSPSLGTFYLGQDAYDNIVKGNAGTVGYDEEPSPIPNNFITGITPMAGAPHIGPQIADAVKFKHDLLRPKGR